jgi:heme-degrading monooxygenase HmoA
MADPLVLINTFEVSHEDAERFIAAWRRGRTTLPLSLVRGYRAASGGQPNADFQFVNIGRWQTAGDFQTATQNPGFRESDARLTGYRPHLDLAGWSALRRLDQGCHQRVSVIITRSAALGSVEGVRPARWRAGLI